MKRIGNLTPPFFTDGNYIAEPPSSSQSHECLVKIALFPGFFGRCIGPERLIVENVANSAGVAVFWRLRAGTFMVETSFYFNFRAVRFLPGAPERPR
jgi:hypothetical protein